MLDHLNTKRTTVQYETPANVAYVAWRKPGEKPLPKSTKDGTPLRYERVVVAPNQLVAGTGKGVMPTGSSNSL